MSVRDENQNGSNNQMSDAMQRARAESGQQGGQQQQQQGNFASGNQGVNTGPGGSPSSPSHHAGFSWRTMGRKIPTPMGRNPMAEILTRLDNRLSEIYKNQTQQQVYNLHVLPIDWNQDPNLTLSVLVIAAQDRNRRDLGVAYHVLLLEGSVEPFPPRFETINGQNVEILRPACDANDNKMVNVVKDHLRRQFPQTQPDQFYSADAAVVPRDFNLDDEEVVYSLAANAAYAVTHELEQRRQGFTDISLSDASKDDSLVVRVGFPKSQDINSVGMPVRKDIAIDLQAVAANQSQQQAALERAVTIAHDGGFVDLIWDPDTAPQNPYAYGAQPVNFHRYAARFVLTSMESVLMSTLPAQLMALVNAMALRENNAWVQTFRPQPFAGQNTLDIHDIGAIGIEVNFEGNQNGIGARIDTKSDAFKPESLAKLVAATIRPGLVISLDVEVCGPDTWYNGAFSAAATGNTEANEAILKAADYLTGGAFGRLFPRGGRVCTDESNLIHMGYYTDANGVKRDIREIDYLAVLNMVGDRDPDVIRDWSDTFYRTQFPLQQRLAARKRIIQNLVPNAVFTGFATRVTFEATFLNALAQACLESGLDVRSITPYADNMAYERATGAYVRDAMLSPNASGLFNRGGYGSYGAYQNPNVGRWQNTAAGFSSRW